MRIEKHASGSGQLRAISGQRQSHQAAGSSLPSPCTPMVFMHGHHVPSCSPCQSTPQNRAQILSLRLLEAGAVKALSRRQIQTVAQNHFILSASAIWATLVLSVRFPPAYHLISNPQSNWTARVTSEGTKSFYFACAPFLLPTFQLHLSPESIQSYRSRITS